MTSAIRLPALRVCLSLWRHLPSSRKRRDAGFAVRRRACRSRARPDRTPAGEFLRPIGEGLGAHVAYAVALPSLQRSHALPFQSVDGIGVGMGLGDRRRAQMLAPVVVMALEAGEIQLPHALAPQGAATLPEGGICFGWAACRSVNDAGSSRGDSIST